MKFSDFASGVFRPCFSSYFFHRTLRQFPYFLLHLPSCGYACPAFLRHRQQNHPLLPFFFQAPASRKYSCFRLSDDSSPASRSQASAVCRTHRIAGSFSIAIFRSSARSWAVPLCLRISSCSRQARTPSSPGSAVSCPAYPAADSQSPAAAAASASM